MSDWLIPELQTAVDALTDTQVVALVLYGEARSEPIEGIVAVANVIRNRSAKPSRFGEGYRGVCLKPWQFSCLSEKGGKGNFTKYVLPLAKRFAAKEPIEDRVTKQCILIAHGAVEDYLQDNTRGATHYFVAKMNPRPEWAYGATLTAHRGAHVFFRDVK